MPPVTFGLTLTPDLPPPLLFGLARLAEALGFDRIWFPDHLLNTGEERVAADVWTILPAVAVKTRRIQIGTAVSDAHRQHPAVLAQRLATLDQLSRGRLALGLGTGEAMNLDPFGIPWDRPLGRLKEVVHVVRGLLDSPAPLDFDGRTCRLRQARITVRPWRQRRIPIYLAALGPKALAYAGQVADGWLPVCIPSGHYAAYLAPLLDSARASGRDPAEIDRVAIVPIAASQDRARVLRTARRHALSLVWPEVLKQAGLAHLLPEDLTTADYRTMNPCDPRSRQTYEENLGKIPDDLLLQFLTFGDLEEIADGLADHVRAGATHLKLVDASPDPLLSTVALAARVMPRLTGRPPTPTARLLQATLPKLARTRLYQEALRRLPSQRRLEPE